jgi:4-hydroxybenzoate polyprenyltransferase
MDRSQDESVGDCVQLARSGEDTPELTPLVSDLDGTLFATDSLFEGVMSLIRRSPWSILWLAIWFIRGGKAGLKFQVASRVRLLPESLPYRTEVVEYLRTERAAGRKIVLATAADQTIAYDVAAHLGCFDEILSSTQFINLKGARKRDELVERFGLRGFDYIGDSKADAPVWAACRIAHVAGLMTRVPRAVLAAGAQQGRVFAGRRPGIRTYLRTMRVYQWVKNLLVVVPSLLNHHIDLQILQSLALAFASFSLVASGTYIANDLFDLEADRRHPRKCRRPLASGELSIFKGVCLAFALTVGGLLLGALGGPKLVACLIVYLGLTTLYSSFVKGKPILDVVVLAMLYTLRVYTGGLVSDVYISPWLFQFSIFFFLSMAFVKRYSELRRLRYQRKREAPNRGYTLSDLSIISQAGVGSGLLAGLLLALYLNGREIERLYPRPEMLWGICPLFLYWMIRVWLIAHRGNMNEDPILYAFHDRVSYIVGLLIVAAAAAGLTPNAG